MKQTYIDINCDLGEGRTLNDCNKDALLMPYISSCNIACGGHAGNELSIRESLLNSKKFNLKAGAHPGYPDRKNFGRISIPLEFSELKKSLTEQIDNVLNIADQEDIHLHHIKLHGALYNDVENNAELASKLAHFLSSNYPSLKIIGLADGEFQRACKKTAARFVTEAFMDRRYLSNGKLSPRTVEGSVISNAYLCINQALALVNKLPILTLDSETLYIQPESICLHGDNPKALILAQALSKKLKASSIIIR